MPSVSMKYDFGWCILVGTVPFFNNLSWWRTLLKRNISHLFHFLNQKQYNVWQTFPIPYCHRLNGDWNKLILVFRNNGIYPISSFLLQFDCAVYNKLLDTRWVSLMSNMGNHVLILITVMLQSHIEQAV